MSILHQLRGMRKENRLGPKGHQVLGCDCLFIICCIVNNGFKCIRVCAVLFRRMRDIYSDVI